jgi:hypothetical protein
MRRLGMRARSLLTSRPEQKCAPGLEPPPATDDLQERVESDVRFRLGIGVAEVEANWCGPRLSMLSSHQLRLVWH